MPEQRIERRVAGYHDIRMDGITDLVVRARGASVLDVGCNRGLVGFEMANNGAYLVHGCDNFEPGVRTANELFADLRSVQSRFEVVDLTRGIEALKPFGNQRYDIVLMLATYHKLARVMSASKLSSLMCELGSRAIHYFGWRGTSTQHNSNAKEMEMLDKDMQHAGLTRIHTSYISGDTLGVAAIWERK